MEYYWPTEAVFMTISMLSSFGMCLRRSIRVPSAFPCNNGFDQSIGIVDANNEFSNSPVGKHKGKRGHQKAEEVKPPLVKQATLSA